MNFILTKSKHFQAYVFDNIYRIKIFIFYVLYGTLRLGKDKPV